MQIECKLGFNMTRMRNGICQYEESHAALNKNICHLLGQLRVFDFFQNSRIRVNHIMVKGPINGPWITDRGGQIYGPDLGSRPTQILKLYFLAKGRSDRSYHSVMINELNHKPLGSWPFDKR